MEENADTEIVIGIEGVRSRSDISPVKPTGGRAEKGREMGVVKLKHGIEAIEWMETQIELASKNSREGGGCGFKIGGSGCGNAKRATGSLRELSKEAWMRVVYIGKGAGAGEVG